MIFISWQIQCGLARRSLGWTWGVKPPDNAWGDVQVVFADIFRWRCIRRWLKYQYVESHLMQNIGGQGQLCPTLESGKKDLYSSDSNEHSRAGINHFWDPSSFALYFFSYGVWCYGSEQSKNIANECKTMFLLNRLPTSNVFAARNPSYPII